jgi:cyclopropane fatty-acyl-phospholipid synthase-like methyltransferase
VLEPPSLDLRYRDVPFPLNVFMYVIAHEEGEVRDLHYGLFEKPEESLLAAQQRSTDLLLKTLPPPPRRILDVGMGLGRTLAELIRVGYDAEGITPDPHQVALARARFGDTLRAREAAFETFSSDRRFDVIVFQESSQYIDSAALFDRAVQLLAPEGVVLVLDEFSVRPVDKPGALHRLDEFHSAAERFGFQCTEETDLSSKAAPTVDYFLERLPRYRAELGSDLGLTGEQLDALIDSGQGYRDLYRSGDYGYLLLQFRFADEAAGSR